jgi:predicted outer membrane protein
MRRHNPQQIRGECRRKGETMKPDEIAKALREAPNYNAGTGTGTIEDDAADLIESQAAENAAYRAENERLAAYLKDMRDQNQTISEKNRELCINLDEREKNSKATQKAMLDEIAKLRNDLAAKTAQLDAEQITSQSLRNAANGYKLELDAERKKANDARNELCLKCGRYHEAHNGACDGCRWGDVTEGGPQ